MSMDYIRKTYGIDLKSGEMVRVKKGSNTPVGGQVGKLIRSNGQYLKVIGSTWRGNFHPLDVERVEPEATDAR